MGTLKEEIHERLRILGATYGGGPVNTTAGQEIVLPQSLRGMVIDLTQQTVERVQNFDTTILINADSLKQQIAGTDFGYNASGGLLRIDVVPNEALEPKIVEISTARFDGLGYLWAISEVFKDIGRGGGNEEIKPQAAFETLAGLSGKRDPRVGIVSSVRSVHEEWNLISQWALNEDSGLKILDPEGDLDSFDMIYFYPQRDWGREEWVVQKLLELTRKGVVIVGLKEIVLDDKRVLVDWGSPYVARTQVVRLGKTPTRSSIVLKPACGTYAELLVIGKTVSQEAFRRAWLQALRDTKKGKVWVAQEMVEPKRIKTQTFSGEQTLKLKLNVFVVGGKYIGTMATLSPSYKIHDCWFNAPIRWVKESKEVKQERRV